MSYTRVTIANDPDKYEAWPGIVQLSDGTLICSYRTADTNTHAYDATGKIVMRTSTDNGLTWSEESTVMDVGEDLDTRTGNLAIFDNNGVETLMQTSQVTHSNGHHDLYACYSTDEGVNWSEPELISTERVTAGKPIQLSDGSLIIPAYKVLSNDYTVSIFKTTDYQNWTEIIVSHSAPLYYNESTVIETSPGNILMVTRFESGTNFIKFKSTDYGATWDNGTEMTFPKYYSKRPSLTIIDDDKLLFSWNDSMWYNRWDISLDEGQNWHTGIYRLNLIVKGYAGSYPESIELSNGKIATVVCTNAVTSDVGIILIDKEDILSRLPHYTPNVKGLNI